MDEIFDGSRDYDIMSRQETYLYSMKSTFIVNCPTLCSDNTRYQQASVFCLYSCEQKC